MLTVKELIREYGKYLDNEPIKFWQAAENSLSNDRMHDLIVQLEALGIQTESDRLAAFDNDIDAMIEMMKKISPSNTFWSRFNFAMYSDVGHYGFDLYDLFQHLKDDRKWSLNPIPKQYAYIAAPDYDLGYFDPQKFEELEF